MEGKLFFGIFALFISTCFSQDPVTRPEFPNVFQTEVQGVFINEKEVAELDGVLYYDRNKNRAALLYTYKNETTISIYNFDSNEIVSIDDNNDCVVGEIPDKPEESFFGFTLDKGKKNIVGAEEVFFFTKAVQDLQELSIIPSLIYKSKLNITQYGKTNCDVIHIFSKPDVELPTCTDQNLCEPTLMTISVRCKNEDGGTDVDHAYNFFRFRKGTVDESAFLPPAGVYCDMKNTRELPQFPSYFSFNFDIIEKPISSNYLAFSMSKKVWYDSNYQIIRIDEFDHTGQLYSSRLFDVKAATAFTIIATIPTCDVGPIDSNVHFDEITRLPKVFFAPNDTSNGAVYVGKRNVHGLEHHVWSLMWTDSDSDAKIVEEIHYLEIVPNEQLKLVKDVKPYLQISHIDTYTYEMNDDKGVCELTLLKHLEINNFRTEPKEWAEFDVASCFNSSQKLIFLMKLKGPPIVKGSLSYLEVLESLYNNIIAATKVSVLRISELTGVFDGVQLVEVRGSILDNSDSTGWQSKSSEPGAKETFRLIKQAAFQGKLTVTFKNENNQISQLNVTSVEAIMIPEDPLPKPEFPEVFQTEVQGIFTIEGEVSELDGVLYYDRNMDRAALLYTYKNESTSIIYNFDINEMTTIDDNDNCVVDKIPDNPEEAFFQYTIWPLGRKELIEPKEFFYFTKAELDRQQLSTIPTLVYTSKLNITKYGQSNCDVTHVFSKPDAELPTCTDQKLCKPTLMTISVNCKNSDGDTVVDHIYNFFRFRRGTVDESAFLPPAGVYCKMKYSRKLPEFPPYFSFTFDIVEKPISSNYLVFSTYKKVWYDSNYKIIRIDEFDYTGLLYSSRIFDVKAATAFTIIATVPTCDAGPIDSNVPFDEITRLPKAFFAPNDTTSSEAVYVGKRTVHGLEYEVWTLMWTVSDSGVKIVEEIHYLEIVPNEELQLVEDIKPYLQISHVDTYTYEMNDDKGVHELTLLKHMSINNFRTKPKEWAAFDVAACFNNSQKKDFVIKLEGPPLVKGSLSYREVLELLYNKIIAATGVSVLRISELTGVFDGVQLVEVRGSILDNSDSTGWQNKTSEPGAEETFRLIKQAASQEKLTVTFKNENDQISQFNVTSVEAIEAPTEQSPGFTGASIAAAGVVMLILGIIFGIAGYYVFLKKRKKPGNFIPLKELNE